MKTSILFLYLVITLFISTTAFSQSQIEKDLCIPKNDERFDSSYVVLAHTMPSFSKEKSALGDYLQKMYKKAKLDIKGNNTTYASFIVDMDGTIKNIKFLRPPADSEVLGKLEKIVATMPRWNPGECDGKAVVVLYNLPLKY